MRVAVSQYEGIDATPVLPLAAGCLVASARADAELAGLDYRVTVARQAIARAVEDMGRPEVLGLPLYPWNAAYALTVAGAVREALPDCLIVAGGPSVPRRPERARRFLQEHAAVDVLAFGEGELTFRELLRARLGGGSLEGIGGIAYRDGCDFHVTAEPVRVLDFSVTASPYLDGTFDELFERNRSRFHMALCETNRGCPFSCTFCDWSLTKRVVEFPIERVMAELDWVVRHGFSHVMLADANFGIRPRDTGIARRLVELKRATGLPSTFYFYLTKNNHGRNLETIEILQSGGIGTWVGLAVQDFDDDVLEAVKRDNIQTGEAMKLRAICGERGIPTFNELILGLPGQTYESFARTIATAMPSLPRHDFVLFLCRLIENAELGDPASRERFGIETRVCQWKTSTPGLEAVIDEYQEVVVGTRNMPVEDWKRTYRLSFLAAALYNLRLLRVALQYVPEAMGISLTSYLELLANHMADAESESVYGELSAVFDAYLDSLLAGGPFVLPYAGSTPIVVEEAVAMAALRRYDEFLAETARLTCGNRSEAMGEAFRYQALITSRWGLTEPIVERFQYDWPAYAGNGGKLAERPVTVRFTPGAAAGHARYDDYAAAHLGSMRARLDSGRVECEARAAQLVVL
ncbi:MAG: B12-binding domain-containing radical SAM protein [Acidobacteria bacterium]|nr:B12-binding domain-containing radical SAM protein [Acidobacteriota bacterium]